MPIQWDILEDQLAQFLKTHRAQSERDTANYLSDKYDIFIKTGRTQYGNGIATSNKTVLNNFIYLALLDAKRGKPLDKVADKISLGIVLYWRSVTMQIIIPPPTAISVVTNVVVFPGTAIKFPIRNTTDASVFSKNLILSFKLHVKLIKGINTALVPAPPGNPVPVAFAWSGIE